MIRLFNLNDIACIPLHSMLLQKNLHSKQEIYFSSVFLRYEPIKPKKRKIFCFYLITIKEYCIKLFYGCISFGFYYTFYVMHYILFEFHFYTIQTNSCMVENVTKRQNGKNKLFGSLIKLKLLTKQLPILL